MRPSIVQASVKPARSGLLAMAAAITLVSCASTVPTAKQVPPSPAPAGPNKETTVNNTDSPCGCQIKVASGSSGSHDPTIVRQGDTYWRFTTGPGIPLAVSDDLIHWTGAGSVFAENPAWTQEQVPGSTHFWAPEVVRSHGEWRVYYSVSTFGSNRSAIGLVTNKTLDPESPDYRWEDQGLVLASIPGESDFNAIDAAVLPVEDGREFLIWGSFWGGIRYTALDPLTGKLPVGITTVDYPDTLATRYTPPNAIEGAFAMKHGDWYYLFVSHDFCCRGVDSDYHIVVGRSKNPTGPYLDKDGRGLDEGGGTTIRDGENDPLWAGPGHCSVFKDQDGTEYLVYHAYSRKQDGKPMLQVEALSWDAEGWPESPAQYKKNQGSNP